MEEARIGGGQSSKERVRKTRSDKRISVKTNLTKESHTLLNRLGMTVGKPKTALATEIVETLLRNPTFVVWIQDKYNVADEFRLTPTTIDGKIKY
ncbi:hypothetical protein BEP19_03360 [Ammoniphilus oxalaticus]|uniref:Uncharacterized protein n=1 Tax=Ammoniphilus oxalaticus TaxID=66863 RepID=A0A419SNV2_9BACL|nr:hypothetical protein [Ammoniphilus oxalaticus]RKD25976.1 hypothetical protein BEP19_03360 [Ammoniphilus oxalaticus]